VNAEVEASDRRRRDPPLAFLVLAECGAIDRFDDPLAGDVAGERRQHVRGGWRASHSCDPHAAGGRGIVGLRNRSADAQASAVGLLDAKSRDASRQLAVAALAVRVIELVAFVSVAYTRWVSGR